MARSSEEQCQARGAKCCRYRLVWGERPGFPSDGPASPREATATRAEGGEPSIESLQDELRRAAERLEEVYSTAAELISGEDLRQLLASITRRAAGAVQATRYLLVVRTSPDEEIELHHHGFDEEEALGPGRGAAPYRARRVGHLPPRRRRRLLPAPLRPPGRRVSRGHGLLGARAQALLPLRHVRGDGPGPGHRARPTRGPRATRRGPCSTSPGRSPGWGRPRRCARSWPRPCPPWSTAGDARSSCGTRSTNSWFSRPSWAPGSG